MNLKKLSTVAAIALTAALFTLGSVSSGEAKGKKKEAAPAGPPPAFCMFGTGAPVCAMKGTNKVTYASACWARKDGAKITAEAACPPKKEMKAKGKSKKKAMKPKKKK